MTILPAARTARGGIFDALRLTAAIAVVVGHAFVLTGHGPAPRVGVTTIHALGVDVFFIISGYLVAGSWARDPDPRRFFARRLLRIAPALTALIVVTVAVIGPLLTSLTPQQYWASSGTWTYLQNLLLIGVYSLPGVFQHGHWTPAVNGCLWTLGLEFIGYAVVATGRLTRSRRPVVPLAALLVIGATLVIIGGVDTGSGATGRVWTYFAIGGLAQQLIPRRAFAGFFALGVGTAWVLAGVIAPPAADVAAWVVVPYLTLTVGLARTSTLSIPHRIGDLSYGTYLWGFLVQQIVIERFGNPPVLTDLLIVLPVTLAIAWLSWHNIEAPALARKPTPPHTQATLRWLDPLSHT